MNGLTSATSSPVLSSIIWRFRMDDKVCRKPSLFLRKNKQSINVICLKYWTHLVLGKTSWYSITAGRLPFFSHLQENQRSLKMSRFGPSFRVDASPPAPWTAQTPPAWSGPALLSLPLAFSPAEPWTPGAWHWKEHKWYAKINSFTVVL